LSDVGIDGAGDVGAEHDAGKPQEALPVGRGRVPAADSGQGQVDDGLGGIAHELKLFGRRHAPPCLDLALLDGGGGIDG
jgi:hypothetical protein